MAMGGKRPGAGRKPGSPNKATATVKEAAQVYTDEALKVLATIMKDVKQPAAARVTAASAILDRGHGKPKQSLDIDANVTTPKSLADFYGGSDT